MLNAAWLILDSLYLTPRALGERFLCLRERVTHRSWGAVFTLAQDTNVCKVVLLLYLP